MEKDLLEWTRFERRGDLERWLRKQGIRYRKGKGGTLCVVAGDLTNSEKSHQIEFE